MHTEELRFRHPTCFRLLLIATCVLRTTLASVPAYVKLTKRCPAECLEFGNCNAEIGTCHCPFGRTGAYRKAYVLLHLYVTAAYSNPALFQTLCPVQADHVGGY